MTGEARVAIVCGASRGIGRAAAEALAATGVSVLAVAREPGALEATCRDISGRGTTGHCLALAGDVADPALPAKAVDFALSRWGRLDILVNNAGGPPMTTLLEADDAAWQAALELSLLSAVRFTRAAARPMIERKWGRIVTVTSTIAREPTPAMILSATARAGLHAFMKAASGDLAQHGVTVNCVAPGGVKTERFVGLMRARAEQAGRPYTELLAERERNVPARRFADPGEIGATIAFLASDAAAYLTGQVIAVDGGLSHAV